ncbi:MAG TPA: type II 3-dehydroquinate dehydratase, partial [Lysobacter sp.]
ARAREAGQTLCIRACAGQAVLLEALRDADAAGAAFVLIDPGSRPCCGPALRESLVRLSTPFLEVHDDHFGALEATAREAGMHAAGVVQGHGAQSYVLALSIALERLGCSECANPFRVGT